MFMPTTEISEPFQIVVKSPIKTKNMKVQTQHVEHGLRWVLWIASPTPMPVWFKLPHMLREQDLIPNNTRQ